MRNHADLPADVGAQLLQLMRNVSHPEILLLLEYDGLGRDRLDDGVVAALVVSGLDAEVGVVEVAQDGVVLLHADAVQDVVDHVVAG